MGGLEENIAAPIGSEGPVCHRDRFHSGVTWLAGSGRFSRTAVRILTKFSWPWFRAVDRVCPNRSAAVADTETGAGPLLVALGCREVQRGTGVLVGGVDVEAVRNKPLDHGEVAVVCGVER